MMITISVLRINEYNCTLHSERNMQNAVSIGELTNKIKSRGGERDRGTGKTRPPVRRDTAEGTKSRIE